MVKPVNIEDGEWKPFGQGDKFQCSRKGLTDSARGAGIGCSLFRLAPGKAAFPKHAHLVNDESIYVLKGSATLIVGDEQFTVREGDYIPLPRGESGAHKLVNTSDNDVEYLCLSTTISPDIVVYPDSNKTGVFHFDREHKIREMYDRIPVDYWKGEAD